MRQAALLLVAAILLLPVGANALDKPTGVTASTDSCWGVYLAWDALPGADSFYVHRNGFTAFTEALFFRDTEAPGGSSDYWIAGVAADTIGDSTMVTGFRRLIPSAPATLSASDTSCVFVRLDWAAAAEADSYAVFRGGIEIDVVVGELFYRDTLASGLYEYGVVAANLCGRSGAAVASGTVLAPPPAPDSVWASTDSCGLIRVEWVPVPGATACYVYREDLFLDEVAGGDSVYRDTLVPAGTYTYWVGAAGKCGRSDSVSAVGTRPFDAPSAPATLSASDTSCVFVRLDWAAAAEADSYAVFRGGIEIDVVVGELFYRDTLASGLYEYGVVAANLCGRSGAAVASGTVLAPPPAPDSVWASTDSCGLIRVEWVPVPGATACYVYREDLFLDEVAGGDSVYRDTLVPAGTYTYWVGAAGKCGRSDSVSAVGTRPFDAPPAPANVSADSVCGGVLLAWSDVEGEAGYAISRDGDSIAAVAAGETLFVDSGAVEGAVHTYRVGPFNSCSGGPVYSGEVTGIRPYDAPPAPALAEATDGLCDSVVVFWTPSPHADEYQVLRGESLLAVVADTFYVDRGPEEGAVYLYGVYASNGCGLSVGAEDSGGARFPPPPPGALVASDTSCALVRLDWTASADADSYVVARDESEIARIASSVLYYEDSIAAGTYGYAVRAMSACGISAPAVDSGSVASPTEVPDSLSASTDSCGVIRIEWVSSPADTGYFIYRGIDFVGETPAGVTFYRDTAADTGAHTYWVGALGTCGRSDSASAQGRRPPDAPLPPLSVSASDSLCGLVRIDWDLSLFADGYEVLRDGVPLDTVGTGSYDDSTIVEAAFHLYTVRAFNTCGFSEESAADTGRRPPDAPPAPGGLTASDSLCGGVLVEWIDGSDYEDGFYVYRDSVKLDTVLAANTFFYFDESAEPGSLLLYQVSAFNGCGESPQPSQGDTGFVLPPPVVVADLAVDSVCGGVRLRWSDVDWEDGYVVVRGGDSITTLAAGETLYVDSNVAPGVPYSFAVGAFNRCSGGPLFGAPVAGIRPYDAPDTPAQVTASDGLCGRIEVSWSAAAHADSYLVHRDGSLAATVAVPFWEDLAAPPKVPHSYGIRAKNSCGVSGERTDAGLRPPDAPAAPGSPAASDTSCKYVLVVWSDVTDEEGYRVYRDGGLIQDVGPGITLYQDATADTGTHFYQIEAYNSCGSNLSMAVQGERILGYPAAPIAVNATEGLCDSIVITWSYPGSVVELDSFQISSRVPGSGPNWTRIAKVLPGAFRYVDRPAGREWEYRVLAFNHCGASEETSGSVDEGMRRGLPVPPVLLASSDAEACAGKTFRLVWNKVVDATAYFVLEGGQESFAGGDTVFTTSRADVGGYTFRVRAEGPCGVSDESGPWAVEVQAAPANPTDVTASQDRCGVIGLAWSEGEASNVWVEREGERYYLSDVTAWDDSLPGGGERLYVVGGWNLCDTLAAADSVSAFAYPVTLSAPTSVEATSGLCDSVVITWSYGGKATGVDSFSVLRFDGPLSRTVAVVGGDAPYSAVDTDVRPGRLYLYQVRAQNRCATATSESDTGFAFASPDTVHWNNPSPSACAGVPYILRWTAVEEAEEYVVRRDGVPFDTTTATQLTVVLNEPGSRQFRVVARNGCGDGPESEPWVLSVATSPSSPSSVVLDSSHCDSVIVSWAVQADSVRVYRSDRVQPLWEGPGDGRLVDTPGKPVTYSVRSYNGCGESDAVTVRLLRPRLRPLAPSSVTATDAYCDSVVVTWTFPQSVIPVAWIDVLRSRNDTTIVVAPSLASGTRRFTDRSGTGSYVYEVVAYNECGASEGEETSYDEGGFLPATAEAHFLSISDSVGCAGASIVLRWEAVAGARNYRLWEALPAGDELLAVLEGGRDSAVVSTPSVGERSFRIQAVGLCGDGARSDPWNVVVAAPPAAPSALRASTDRCGEVLLQWSPPAGLLAGVRVYREGEAIAFVALPESTFVDTTITEEIAYAYSVAAENRCGSSPRSAEATGFSRPGLAAPVLVEPLDGADSLAIPVTVRWQAVEGALGYLLRVELVETEEAVLDTLLQTVTGFAVLPLELGRAYRWQVAVRSECGVGIPSPWRTFTTLDMAPAPLWSDPSDGETDVPVDVTVRVAFTSPIDPAMLAGARLLREGNGGEVAGTRTLEGGGSELLFTPGEPLEYGMEYVFDISGLGDVFGRSFEELPPISFTTRPAERPVGDFNGDYQRDPADVDLAVSILTGVESVDDYPLDRLDLNGDGRFNVADLVLLGHIFVQEGASVLPGAKEERIAAPLAVEPGEEPGDLRLLLPLELPFSARTGYLEVVLPGSAVEVSGLSVTGAGSPVPEVWHAREGGLLRVLVTPGEGGPLLPGSGTAARLEICITGVKEFGGETGVERMIWSDEEGVVRCFRGDGGAIFSPSPASTILLRPNRPNPFNPATELHYYLPEPSFVRLRVFDLRGRAVTTLAEGWQAAGWRTALWEGKADGGSPVVSGVYFGRLETPAGTRTVRMTLVR